MIDLKDAACEKLVGDCTGVDRGEASDDLEVSPTNAERIRQDNREDLSENPRNSIFFITGSFPVRSQAASAALLTPLKEMAPHSLQSIENP